MIRTPLKIRSINLNPTQAPCGNLPPSFPQRAPQTVGLTSSPVSTTEISFLSSDANDSSRFSPPASGPSPRSYQKDRTSYRRYQRPTAADFFSPRSSRHLLVLPLQLLKLMLMTFFLTLRYQMMVQRMKYNLELIVRSILYHPLAKMIIARNPNLRNPLHLIQV